MFKIPLKTLFVFPLFSLTIQTACAGFQEGQKLFEAHCSACHLRYVPEKQIKENFFEKNNTMLKLKAPTANMLAWAITEGPRKIGDPEDPEMRQAEIEEYLKDALEHPDPDDSICNRSVMKYYAPKKPILGLKDREIANLASYFIGYKVHRKAKHPKAKRRLGKAFSLKELLAEAKKSGKTLIVEASSPTCHYCKKMEKEVIDDPEIRAKLRQGFLLTELNVDETRLPPKLSPVYQQITPSFFFLSPQGELLGHYPGSWNKSDFSRMLDQFAPKKRR